VPPQVFIGAFDDSESSSDSDVEMEEKIERTTSKTTALPNGKTPKQKPLPAKKASKVVEDDDDEDDEEDEEDEDVAWSDLDEHDDDLIPHQKLTINNTTALLASLKRIQIPTDGSAPFVSHQSIVGRAPTADAIPDVQDDLARELQFYAQSLDAARRARALLLKEGVPFSRPTDYFAEMIKDDPHMDKVKSRLVADASAKKAASEARKQRDLKKFGKQVQVAKLQERQKAKKDTLDKIKTLKRSASSPCALPSSILNPLPQSEPRPLTSILSNRASRVLGRSPDARGRPLRRRRRRRAQGPPWQARPVVGQALEGRPRRRPARRRRRAQPQTPAQERKVRLRRQEAARQVGRRPQLGRPQRLQRPAHEGRRARGRPRRRQGRGRQGVAPRQGQAESRCWEKVTWQSQAFRGAVVGVCEGRSGASLPGPSQTGPEPGLGGK